MHHMHLAFCYKCYLIAGEKLYIGQLTEKTPGATIRRMQLFIPGIITPSKDSFTFCDYNAPKDKLLAKTVRVDKAPCHVLTSKVPDLLYWEPAEKFTSNHVLPRNIVMLDPVVRDDQQCLLFIAQVPPTVVDDGKVIGLYDKAKFPADFNGPIVGAGQAWLDKECLENVSAKNFYEFQFSSYTVNVFYDGKIIEAPNFSFLCTYMPKLSHHKSEFKWEMTSGGLLPINALPAGIYPNGEVLYVAKKWHQGDEIPGYVMRTEKSLHLCCGCAEHCYSNGYKILTVEEPVAFEWGTYSHGEVPPNAVPGGTTKDCECLYIGRTVTNSDVTVGKTTQFNPIRLPHSKVTNTQLVGKIHCSHRCLYVPWDGKEYHYPSYEVLMRNFMPKSLQHLCRNVIITATLGIPGRIDELSLPLDLIDFCKGSN